MDRRLCQPESVRCVCNQGCVGMSNTGMMQRGLEHDYCAPCFYMVTVVTEPRRDCLGALRVANGEAATVALSPLGEVVREVWQRTSVFYRDIEACECVVMPDHFHGILWVKARLARPMGHVVKAFKRVSENECRSRGLLPEPNPAAAPAAGFTTLWQPGFQGSILLRRGQLKAMAAYIADTPRRLGTGDSGGCMNPRRNLIVTPDARGLAFEISEDLPPNWCEAIPVVLETLKEAEQP